ncbi:MAG: tRNA pseudouridine(55) synthase TruB [Succinivibrio sp.]|nr:tRNA pseudouridine(55) synthase TruB [Succinivibrio sp.]
MQNTIHHPQSRLPKREVSGIVLLDKPYGLSSSAALTRVRGIYRALKGGHTGALDPLASGLLPICLGQSAKFSSFFLEGRKKYQATGKLGIVTSTADAEGEVISRREIGNATDRLEDTVKSFIGRITQVPPLYSAVKVGGKPLYKYARQGRGDKVEIPSREVEIYDIRVLSVTADSFSVEVYCSKGTYIRTLIADIGEALGCGAYVTMLRRIAVQGLPEGQMVCLDQLQEICDSREDLQDFSTLDALLYPIDKAMSYLPAIHLPYDLAEPFTHGVRQGPNLAQDYFDNCDDTFAGPVQIRCDGRFLGVGHLQKGVLIPDRMMSNPFN